VKKHTRFYPRSKVRVASVHAVGNAGGALLAATVTATGLDGELDAALAPWRKPLAVHSPAKVILDLALALALGGDCPADIAQVRAEPALFGPVASDATVSRTISALAKDADVALNAIHAARAKARAVAWAHAKHRAPGFAIHAKAPLIIDLDATLVTSHSEKEQAAPTYRKGFGFHPLTAFSDHGTDGTGEPLAIMLRPGNAGANTAKDHIAITTEALKQVPGWGTKAADPKAVLIRADTAGGTHEFVQWLTDQGLSYSVGFRLPPDALAKLGVIDQLDGWTHARDTDGDVRDGAWVTELTGLLDLTRWPPGIRVIVRKERPHPGAQTSLFDYDGHRITAFATNTEMTGGPAMQHCDLEVRHRRRARCEDRIRNAKDTGLANLPLQGFDQNRIWLAIVQLAMDLTAWMQTLALHGHAARKWEPKRLRHRLYAIGAQITSHARAKWLTLSKRSRWAKTIGDGLQRLHRLNPATV